MKIEDQANGAEPLKLFLTVADAAKVLQLGERTLREYLKFKKGPRIVRLGRKIRIRSEDLLAWASKDRPSIFTNKDR